MTESGSVGSHSQNLKAVGKFGRVGAWGDRKALLLKARKRKLGQEVAHTRVQVEVLKL